MSPLFGLSPLIVLACAALCALAASLFLVSERPRRWRASYSSRRAHHARQLGRRRADELTRRERLLALWFGRRESPRKP